MMIPPPDPRPVHAYSTPRGTCPECGSGQIAHYLLGMPDPTILPTLPEWVTLGGCCIGPDVVDRRCEGCGHEWTAEGTSTETELHFGTDLWDEITPVARRAGPRRAAIAFLGNDAPDLLGKFCSRDRLVVNAGSRALASGATSPVALETLFERGVQLRSYDRLHAKVIVTREWAVIGSSNASNSSNRSEEAVVITCDPTLVKDARTMVDGLWTQSVVIDREFIMRAKRITKDASAAGTGVPGVIGTELFPPRPVRRVHFAENESVEVSAEVHEAMCEARTAARRESRPGLTLESWWDPSRSSARAEDVLIRFTCDDDDCDVEQPSRIVSKTKVPGAGNGWVYVLQSMRDRDGVWLSEVADTLIAAELDVDDLNGAIVDDPDFIESILELWEEDGDRGGPP
ncbi:phospholipase D-like domain-containing protein [Gordonia sp. (in: high G+C Gram-positive bacteria)]|uniref:phospholipase D-like domain-containing protein n=1 Tax=Gordonia sp. (in: high G+C Gram-positive bacteria) TaxID=84139 RepID=UPI003C759085